MAGERTEPATPKRRNDLRNKGQYPKSPDFNSAVMLSVGLYLLFAYTPHILNRLEFISIHTFSNLNPSQINAENLAGILSPYLSLLAELVLPFLIILMITGIILMRVQVGHILNWGNVMPDFNRLSPMSIVSGLRNMFNFFNPKSLVEMLKSFVKLCIVGAFAYMVINARKQELLNLLGADLSESFQVISDIMAQLITQICVAMFIIGIVDKKYQHYEFEKSIKMTKEEVKDEARAAEGDPIIKAKIKAAQRQMAMQRMMSAVPSASVVVTNPTHYAIALKYEQGSTPAPQVVAKGVDFVAFKIIEIAKNNNIPIVENKPLARTLHKIVPLEGFIPAELYAAVAEVLAYVYKMNKGRSR